jgi:hypothetical protein
MKPNAKKVQTKKKVKMAKSKKETEAKVEPKMTIKELSLEDILPNSIDGVDIYNDEGKAGIYLQPLFDKDKLKRWLKGRGGIILKDLKANLKDGREQKYALVTRDLERFIVRFIARGEHGHFNSLKLINGKIKDASYMIIKNLGEDEKIKSYGTRYIEESNIIETDKIIVTNKAADDSEDFDAVTRSVSLFED